MLSIYMVPIQVLKCKITSLDENICNILKMKIIPHYHEQYE